MFSVRAVSWQILPGIAILIMDTKFIGSSIFFLPIPIKFPAIQKPTENIDRCKFKSSIYTHNTKWLQNYVPINHPTIFSSVSPVKSLLSYPL